MEDKSELCARWEENGGCALDRDFVISELDPWNGNIPNREFFDFMQMSCPASCGWADQRGCVDEHPRCEEWTRAGICNTHPFFMAHTCRESCGVCGFLSPFNTEDQEVNGASYSEYKNDNFKCGEFKLLCEINDGSILDCRRRKREVDLGSRRHRRAAGGFSLIRNSAFTGLGLGVPSSDSYSYDGR